MFDVRECERGTVWCLLGCIFFLFLIRSLKRDGSQKKTTTTERKWSHSHRVEYQFSRKCQIENESYQSNNILIESTEKITSVLSNIGRREWQVLSMMKILVFIFISRCLSITARHRELSCLLSRCDIFTTFSRRTLKDLSLQGQWNIFKLQ